MKANYPLDSAFRKVLRVGTVKQLSSNFLVVKNGTVGIKTLGAIHYLKRFSDYVVSVVSEEYFDALKVKTIK